MKRLLSLPALFVILVTLASAHAETAKVIVKEATLREQCKFLSPATARLHYNDSIDIISRETDWFKVTFGNARGCLHKSAVEARAYSLSGVQGARAGDASQEEISLAGKGFTPEVEKSYRRQHSNLNYRDLDKVESYHISDDSLRAFIVEGGLKQP